jgi:peptidoglycan/xylan/chitin deacetylase (PgdA/CDA1 family)
VTDKILIHGVAGPPGTPLARWLDTGPQVHGSFRPAVGPFPWIVSRLSGPPATLDEAAAGLPDGAARPEAVAVRLRRAGATLAPGEPDVLPDLGALLRLCRARGRSSIALIRADPSLTPELQIGAWYQTGWRGRAARRFLCRLPLHRFRSLPGGPLGFRTATDAAFWAGVRAAAAEGEWRRLTSSSYVALCYHRLAGEGKPGQQSLDVDPRRFEAQMRLMRVLGFRPLDAERILAFHHDPTAILPRGRFVLTADDGFLDCVEVLAGHLDLRPLLFVPTELVGGGRADWADGEPLAGWEDLQRLEGEGATLGSHGRGHISLAGAGIDRLREELAGSWHDLQSKLARPAPILAYPFGHHDADVLDATRDAGYRAAFTTDVGRNGAGTDVHCLRRITVKDDDTLLMFLWKVMTGEPPPGWLRIRRPGSRVPRSSPGSQAPDPRAGAPPAGERARRPQP